MRSRRSSRRSCATSPDGTGVSRVPGGRPAADRPEAVGRGAHLRRDRALRRQADPHPGGRVAFVPVPQSQGRDGPRPRGSPRTRGREGRREGRPPPRSRRELSRGPRDAAPDVRGRSRLPRRRGLDAGARRRRPARRPLRSGRNVDAMNRTAVEALISLAAALALVLAAGAAQEPALSGLAPEPTRRPRRRSPGPDLGRAGPSGGKAPTRATGRARSRTS